MKPDSFAAVMATGIVWIAAVDHGYRAISDVLIVLALADDGVAGVLLDRVRDVGHCGDRIAAAISAITRCGYSFRSSHVKRNTFQPLREILFCRVRSC